MVFAPSCRARGARLTSGESADTSEISSSTVNPLRTWVKRCFDNLVDPDKDAEVAELTELLHKGIAARKKAFVLAEVLQGREYKQRHLEHAKLNLYSRFLSRAWKNGRVQPAERETLEWAAKCIELSTATQR